MTEMPRLHLRLLGPFGATLHTPDGRTVTLDVSRCRAQVKVALGVLAYDGHPPFTVEADRLIRILWGEVIEGPGEVSYAKGIETQKTGDEIARSRLTRLINEMRSVFGDGSGGDGFVERSEAKVGLIRTSADLVEFDSHWEAGRHEEAREIAARGGFLAGVQIQKRNESARRWLESARLDWSQRVGGLFQRREAELAAAGERKEAALWAAGRHTVALAHGLNDVAEEAQQSLRLHEANNSPTLGFGGGGAEPTNESEPADEIVAELDAFVTDGTAAVRVALLCGNASVWGKLHASTSLATHGLELSLPKGTSRPFSHGHSLKEALVDATHCLYLLARGERPDLGWAAFSAALAREAEIPFRVVTFASEETAT